MPTRPARRCACGAPTSRTRCLACERTRNETRAHYQGDYRQRAATVRAEANANPDTICWRCGEPARPGDPWQAGHTVDSDPNAPLAPEHRSCNATAGRALQNERRLNR